MKTRAIVFILFGFLLIFVLLLVLRRQTFWAAHNSKPTNESCNVAVTDEEVKEFAKEAILDDEQENNILYPDSAKEVGKALQKHLVDKQTDKGDKHQRPRRAPFKLVAPAKGPRESGSRRRGAREVVAEEAALRTDDTSATDRSLRDQNKRIDATQMEIDRLKKLLADRAAAKAKVAANAQAENDQNWPPIASFEGQPGKKQPENRPSNTQVMEDMIPDTNGVGIAGPANSDDRRLAEAEPGKSGSAGSVDTNERLLEMIAARKGTKLDEATKQKLAALLLQYRQGQPLSGTNKEELVPTSPTTPATTTLARGDSKFVGLMVTGDLADETKPLLPQFVRPAFDQSQADPELRRNSKASSTVRSDLDRPSNTRMGSKDQASITPSEDNENDIRLASLLKQAQLKLAESRHEQLMLQKANQEDFASSTPSPTTTLTPRSFAGRIQRASQRLLSDDVNDSEDYKEEVLQQLDRDRASQKRKLVRESTTRKETTASGSDDFENVGPEASMIKKNAEKAGRIISANSGSGNAPPVTNDVAKALAAYLLRSTANGAGNKESDRWSEKQGKPPALGDSELMPPQQESVDNGQNVQQQLSQLLKAVGQMAQISGQNQSPIKPEDLLHGLLQMGTSTNIPVPANASRSKLLLQLAQMLPDADKAFLAQNIAAFSGKADNRGKDQLNNAGVNAALLSGITHGQPPVPNNGFPGLSDPMNANSIASRQGSTRTWDLGLGAADTNFNFQQMPLRVPLATFEANPDHLSESSQNVDTAAAAISRSKPVLPNLQALDIDQLQALLEAHKAAKASGRENRRTSSKLRNRRTTAKPEVALTGTSAEADDNPPEAQQQRASPAKVAVKELKPPIPPGGVPLTSRTKMRTAPASETQKPSQENEEYDDDDISTTTTRRRRMRSTTPSPPTNPPAALSLPSAAELQKLMLQIFAENGKLSRPKVAGTATATSAPPQLPAPMPLPRSSSNPQPLPQAAPFNLPPLRPVAQIVQPQQPESQYSASERAIQTMLARIPPSKKGALDKVLSQVSPAQRQGFLERMASYPPSKQDLVINKIAADQESKLPAPGRQSSAWSASPIAQQNNAGANMANTYQNTNSANNIDGGRAKLSMFAAPNMLAGQLSQNNGRRVNWSVTQDQQNNRRQK